MGKLVFAKTVLLIGALTVSAPVFAQNDFSGEWAPVRNQDNSENPLIGDWVGIPLNEAGIARSGDERFRRSLPKYSGDV